MNENKYRCCMCKNEWHGSPAMSNICGDFCPQCNEEKTKRMNAAQTGRRKSEPRIHGDKIECYWCGDPFPFSTSGGDEKAVGVCPTCRKNRQWLLHCISIGPRPAAYVASREEKEAPLRAERARLQKVNIVNGSKTPPLAAETDARIEKMERMMERLLSALGEKSE